MAGSLPTPLRSSWNHGLLEGGGRSRAPTAPGPVSGGLGGPVLCVSLIWGRNQLRVPTQLPRSLQVLLPEGTPLWCNSHPLSRAPLASGGHSLHGPLGNGSICIYDVISWLLSPTMYFSGVLDFQCGFCSPADILLNLRSTQPHSKPPWGTHTDHLLHRAQHLLATGSGSVFPQWPATSGSIFRCWAGWLRKPVKGRASRSPVSAAGRFRAWLQ